MFKKASEHSGGNFFKPADRASDIAILIEPTVVNRGVSYTTFDGKPDTRDEVLATVTIFGTSESLSTGEPSSIVKNAKVTHGMLVGTLIGVGIGSATVVRLDKAKTQKGTGWVFRDCPPDIEAQVVTYYEKREAALAAALADAPSFD